LYRPADVGPPSNLATQDFWEEDYYRGIEVPVRPDDNFPFERCLARTLEALAPVARGVRVLEIGCAPARWLLWYAERFGAEITGLELSTKGVQLSRENLAAAGIKGEIVEADLFSDTHELGTFDLVLSLGVIEHFDDIPAAFAPHAAFVRSGGRLVIGMPNYRGLIGLLQRFADIDHLRLHNKQAMEPRLYRFLADEYEMRLEHARYINGIDPAMVNATTRRGRMILRPLNLWRRFGLSDRVNHRLVSSYLLLTFVRPS
jgi:SAM-dependent methyltransferase